ncbi:MAG TPA: stage III sporulation protein AE [Bacillota bacterium]|nr:stage III sporulation protein AE [Bacillota bacterium]
MKKLLILCAAILIILGLPVLAFAETVTGDKTESIDLSQIQDYLTRVDSEMAPYIPDLRPAQLLENLKQGKLSISVQSIFTGILKLFSKELMANLHLLGQLLILGVIAAVLENITGSFESGTVGKAAQAVVFMVIITLAIGSLTIAANLSRTVVEDMVNFMQAILPVLLTLLAAMGGLASAAIFHPAMVLVLGLTGTVVRNVIIPLIFLSAILGFVNNISDKFKVSRLAGLFRQASITLMMLMLTLFTGVIAVEGVAGSVADGVALRTAKFATDNFVPVVGGMFSDALDAVVGGSLLLKNGVGIAGVVVIFWLCALPALKIVALVAVYKLSAALMQPIGAKAVADCLEHMEKSLAVFFAAVAIVGLMFFFTITIVVGAGNAATMLR